MLKNSTLAQYKEIIENGKAEILVDVRIQTNTKMQNSIPDIFVHDRKKSEIVL